MNSFAGSVHVKLLLDCYTDVSADISPAYAAALPRALYESLLGLLQPR